MIATIDLTLAGAGVLTLLGVGIRGTFHRNSAIFGRVMSRLPSGRRQVALTFDDGPNPDATPRILDVLAKHEVKATFFVLGRHATRWPSLVQRIVDDGHLVGNHGYAHRRMHLAGPTQAFGDLRDGTRAIEDACGVTPRHFRAPHGFRSPFVAAAARRLGQITVGWTIGVWDSDRPGVSQIAHRTLAGVRAGSIVLLHDGDGYDPLGDRSQTAEAIAHVVPALMERQFSLTALPA